MLSPAGKLFQVNPSTHLTLILRLFPRLYEDSTSPLPATPTTPPSEVSSLNNNLKSTTVTSTSTSNGMTVTFQPLMVNEDDDAEPEGIVEHPDLHWEDGDLRGQLLVTLNQMRKDKHFCDVTLQVGNRGRVPFPGLLKKSAKVFFYQ